MRCVVIGGGIIGLMTARELHAAGVEVMVLERGEAGRESSWAGGGILSPLCPWRYPAGVAALAAWSQAHYPELAAALMASTGIDPEWTPSGLLSLDSAEEVPAFAWAEANACRLERLTAREVRAREPALAQVTRSALWFPDVAQIRNPRLMKALRADLLARGIGLREGLEARHLRIEEGRVTGVGTDTGVLDADTVVVAAGAWTGAFLRALGLHADVSPVRGQILLLRARSGLLRSIVLRGELYLIPRRDGRILVGSTVERAGFDKSTTPEARVNLHAAALALAPSLGGAEIEAQWAGLRPGSPGGIPFICPYPDIAGLYLNAGHYRNGLVLAPASARLLTDLITGRPPILAPAAYSWRE
jgi:glycine oxidase